MKYQMNKNRLMSLLIVVVAFVPFAAHGMDFLAQAASQELEVQRQKAQHEMLQKMAQEIVAKQLSAQQLSAQQIVEQNISAVSAQEAALKEAGNADESAEDADYKGYTGKRINCGECGKKIESSNIRRHERIHTGEKRHECDVCKKKFTEAASVKRHKKSVHEIKPSLICRYPGCQNSFTHQSYRSKHEKMHEKKDGWKSRPKKRKKSDPNYYYRPTTRQRS